MRLEPRSDGDGTAYGGVESTVDEIMEFGQEDPVGTVEHFECSQCHETVALGEVRGREVAVDVVTGDPHKCWEVPEDAELLVLSEEE